MMCNLLLRRLLLLAPAVAAVSNHGKHDDVETDKRSVALNAGTMALVRQQRHSAEHRTYSSAAAASVTDAQSSTGTSVAGGFAASKALLQSISKEAKEEGLPGKHLQPQAAIFGERGSSHVSAYSDGVRTAVCRCICALAALLVVAATFRLMMRRPIDEPLDIMSAVLLCGAYVAIAATSDILVKWETQANNGSLPFAPARMVFVVEVMKLILTMPLVFGRLAQGSLKLPTRADCETAIRLMLVPAISYSMNNAIIFVVVAHVDFSSLSVWRQLTPMFVAFIWILVFRRQLGGQRWFALALLVVGTTLNSCGQAGGLKFNAMVFVVLCSCLTTAVAGVANEYVLKRCGHLDIDFLCVLLYIQTSVISLLLAVSMERTSMARLAGAPVQYRSTLLGGPPLVEDPRPAVIILLQVLFGFAVARVIRYLGSIPRAIVNALKELAVVALAPAFTNSHINGAVLISAVIVGGAAALFTLAPAPLPNVKGPKRTWSPVT